MRRLGPGGGGKVTIEWMDIATTEPSQTLYPQIAKAYEAAHPDVKIKLTNLENEAFKSKMTALTASGKLPDIFVTWGGACSSSRSTPAWSRTSPPTPPPSSAP